MHRNPATNLRVIGQETPEELSEHAKEVRAFADRIEKGQIISIAWVATHRTGNEFETGWVNTQAIHDTEIIGQVAILQARMIADLESE